MLSALLAAAIFYGGGGGGGVWAPRGSAGGATATSGSDALAGSALFSLACAVAALALGVDAALAACVRAAGEAEFAWRFPAIAREIARRKLAESVLAALPAPRLAAELGLATGAAAGAAAAAAGAASPAPTTPGAALALRSPGAPAASAGALVVPSSP
jgi:hypothetical protein